MLLYNYPMIELGLVEFQVGKMDITQSTSIIPNPERTRSFRAFSLVV